MFDCPEVELTDVRRVIRPTGDCPEVDVTDVRWRLRLAPLCSHVMFDRSEVVLLDLRLLLGITGCVRRPPRLGPLGTGVMFDRSEVELLDA